MLGRVNQQDQRLLLLTEHPAPETVIPSRKKHITASALNFGAMAQKFYPGVEPYIVKQKAHRFSPIELFSFETA